VHQTREVDLELGIKERREKSAAGVDDHEHRRCDHICVAGGARGLNIEVQGVGLADRFRVLANLFTPHRVKQWRVALADLVGRK
jgi:hypothetical protein